MIRTSTRAELTYTEWETDLQMEIGPVESDRPGYDEYRYNLGAIEHDPYVLMGYLTSAYQGFTYDEVESVLRQLFQEQYTCPFQKKPRSVIAQKLPLTRKPGKKPRRKCLMNGAS